MKFKFAVLMVFALLLAACAPAAIPTPVATAPVKDDPCKYYFLAGNNSDPFYVPGVAGFMDSAKQLGVKAEFVGPQDASMAGQVATWETLLASPDTCGILLYAFDYKAEDQLIKETIAKGIPLVLGAADSPSRERDAFIGYDNTLLGITAADYALKICGPTCKYGSIGVNGANVIERRAAFEKRLTEAGATVFETVTHDGSAENKAKVLDTYTVAHPDMDLLWFADGGAGVMAQPWKEKQAAGVKTKFLAMDMPDATVQAVKDGVFVATIAQETRLEEFYAMIMLYNLKNGVGSPDTVYLKALIIDQTNVDQYLPKK